MEDKPMKFEKFKPMHKEHAALSLGIGMVHLFYLLLYIHEKCFWMCFLNVLSIAMYGTIAYRIRYMNKIFVTYVMAFFEVAVYAMLATILCGLSSGYLLFYMGLAQLVFFYLYNTNHKFLKMGLVYGLGIILPYLVSYSLGRAEIGRLYQLSASGEIVLYIVNSLLLFFMVISMLVIFVTKNEKEKAALTKENIHLENSANYDTLTRLLNRRSLDTYMLSYLQMAVFEDKSFCVLMCDIDDFKKVNDVYGHECGDLVLQKVADTLKAILRGDDVVFRWGGEEILILLSGKQYVGEAIGERCREAIASAQVEYKGKIVKVTITIGGCTYFQGATQESIIKKADENLYKGKKNGKNQVVF